MADEYYDGIGVLGGVSGANPTAVPKELAASAVNIRNRYGKTRPRCAFQHLRLEFDNTAQQYLFEGGNFQGATFYHSYSGGLGSIVCSIAGTIFRIQIEGSRGIVTKLFEGHDPVLTHAWFTQGFEWLVIQNGYNRPILWNGTDKARFSQEVDNEVPIGSVMTFIHGRFALASADGTNQIAVGDIVYGNTATDTSDIIRFTETSYWAEGGAFGVPVYVGDINGMAAMPYLDTGTGQNELVVLGTQGAITLDLSRPRSTWLDSQLLRISLIGGGCVSTHSTATMNGDLFFRSSEGVRSYRNARSEFQQSWSQAPISTDVRRWIDADAPRLLEYNSQVSWNNYLFSTCSPLIEKASNQFAGHHRYHRGFVVLDAQPESTTTRSGAPAWNGMWTGIRPTQFVTGELGGNDRCFAFSYDRDGVNRLYEITEQGLHDSFEGRESKTYSHFESGSLGYVSERIGSRDPKILQGGEIEFSKVHGEARIELAIRPDNSPCFSPIRTITAGCECAPKECGDIYRQPTPYFGVFGGLSDKCQAGFSKPLNKVRKFQARVAITGYAEFESLLFRMTRDTRPTNESCDPQCAEITCCDKAAYSYHVAPEGENNNAYTLPRPSDVPDEVYVGFAKYTARCKAGTGTPVTVSATATSTISQADADVQASAKAKAAAEGKLQCRTCESANLAAFTLNDSSYDLSAFFETGLYEEGKGRPWRFIDAQTLIVYASGIVDDTGTLEILYAAESGDVIFDAGTKILTDVSATPVLTAAQLGCPGDDFPDFPDYFPS